MQASISFKSQLKPKRSSFQFVCLETTAVQHISVELQDSTWKGQLGADNKPFYNRLVY